MSGHGCIPILSRQAEITSFEVKIMKNNALNIILVGLLLAHSIANSAELISFEDVRAKYQSTGDATRITYLSSRCAALHISLSALMLKANSKESSELYRQSAVEYMKLAGQIQSGVDSKRGIVNANVVKDISISVLNITELYSARLNGNYAKSGDYIVGDVQIEEELSDCKNRDAFTRKIIGNEK